MILPSFLPLLQMIEIYTPVIRSQAGEILTYERLNYEHFTFETRQVRFIARTVYPRTLANLIVLNWTSFHGQSLYGWSAYDVCA